MAEVPWPDLTGEEAAKIRAQVNKESEEGLEKATREIEATERAERVRAHLLAHKSPDQIQAILKVEQWQREASKAVEAEYSQRAVPPANLSGPAGPTGK